MARAALDVIVALIFCVLTGVPAAATGYALNQWNVIPNDQWWRWALAAPVALVFLVGLLATAFVLRLCLPRPKPGHYPFPKHPMAFIWLLHFSLQRMMYLPLWRHFMFSFSTLRWALLNALGAKAAFEMNTSSDVMILDPSMMELGPDTMIAAGTTLAGHLVEKEKLLLGKVRLARGVQVHGNVLIGPGVTIGEHTMVGPECRIANDVIVGEYAHLGAGCYLAAGTRLGDNVVLGHQVMLEQNVVVGDGAVVATGARVPRGTKIAAGEHFPPRKKGNT